MRIFKADTNIVHENDFEELEKGIIYIDRQGGFIALVDPKKSDALLVDLELADQQNA